ncbi:MAG: hypothetical protein L0L05_10735, partial [Yaniella sp.]|nr:hypothetical protein [Yaniella sp.]
TRIVLGLCDGVFFCLLGLRCVVVMHQASTTQLLRDQMHGSIVDKLHDFRGLWMISREVSVTPYG